MSAVFDRKKHWESVYNQTQTSHSWFQQRPAISLELITQSGVDKSKPLIDIGGGDSNLVDHLLADGFQDITVLDIAGPALALTRDRLGSKANEVTWLEGDITGFEFKTRYQLWHDRAVFHFLTNASDRQVYLQSLNNALCKGGHLIMATFAIDGPLKCSGLEIVQYDAETLLQELGTNFRLVTTLAETHLTPKGNKQSFNYFMLQKIA